jgi:hypothetical protein
VADIKHKNREEFIIIKRYYGGVWLEGLRTDIHNKIVAKMGKKIHIITSAYSIPYPEDFEILERLMAYIDRKELIF